MQDPPTRESSQVLLESSSHFDLCLTVMTVAKPMIGERAPVAVHHADNRHEGPVRAWNKGLICNNFGQLPFLHILVCKYPGQSVLAVASFGHSEAHSMLAQ